GLLHRLRTLLPAKVNLPDQSCQKEVRNAAKLENRAALLAQSRRADFLGFIQLVGLRLVQQSVSLAAFPGGAFRGQGRDFRHGLVGVGANHWRFRQWGAPQGRLGYRRRARLANRLRVNEELMFHTAAPALEA